MTTKRDQGDSVALRVGEMDEILSIGPAVVYVAEATGDYAARYVSPNVETQLGYKPSDFTDDGSFWASHIHPEDAPQIFDGLQSLFEHDHHAHEYRFRLRDDSYVWMLDELKLIRDLGGEPLKIIGCWTNISERKETEEALRQSEARLTQAQNLAKIGHTLWDEIEGRMTYCSETVNLIWGAQAKEIFATFAEFLDTVHPDDRARANRVMMQAVKDQTRYEIDYRIVRPDDEIRFIRQIAEPELDKTGRLVRTVSTVQDITEQKHSEERLNQAQKMEAVGQLTGGVAHDFNNLLAVIGGNADLLTNEGGSNSALTAPIVHAVKRGAELTQRLLAFSRQQPLRPQVIGLRELVSGMPSLLIRTLGETIELKTSASPDLWNVLADPGQVETALLNLAINARDAMPNGGKLIIECANTQLDETYVTENSEALVGDYVVLAVSDNGSGMTADVQAHAFEPFFTTKEVGEGSGLGLSMVYGFAKQSGGHAMLDSEEGQGTTVKLYLPRAREAVTSESAPRKASVLHGQGEVILAIEDDPDVRDLAVRMLESLGYQAIDVPDAASAHRVLAEGKQVDLVLSDVVLPGGTSGSKFAEEARTIYPDLKIIFMSGYPAEAATCNGFLGSDNIMLSKPFERCRLAEALRGALG